MQKPSGEMGQTETVDHAVNAKTKVKVTLINRRNQIQYVAALMTMGCQMSLHCRKQAKYGSTTHSQLIAALIGYPLNQGCAKLDNSKQNAI